MSPMRRLMLLRHAKSDRPAGVDDHDRPLAERGRHEGAAMGRHMAAAGLAPDLAIVSTARRAQETWQVVRPAFAGDIDERAERRLYEASARSILHVAREAGADVRTLLLIGHNPGFHELALALIGKAEPGELARLRQGYPTAALVVIDFDLEGWRDLATGAGRLERYLTPKSA